MKMDDDTATAIVDMYHDTKKMASEPVERFVRSNTILRVYLQLGWEIVDADIDAALQYCRDNPLGGKQAHE